MASRTLASVFSGFLAGTAGGLAGEQAGKDRALQLAEMKRRQAMQDEDQAMQRFSFGAQVEDRARQDALGPYDDAIRSSDPNAEGYGALWDQRAQAEQGLGPRRFGPGALPFFGGGGGGTPAAPNAGTTGTFSAQAPAQMQQAPGMGVPTQVPVRPVRLDPKFEKSKAALLDQWKTIYSDIVQVDRGTAMELGGLIRRVNAGEFKDLAAAEALAAPVIARTRSKFQTIEDAKKAKLAQDDIEQATRIDLDKSKAEEIRANNRLLEDNRVRDDVRDGDQFRGKALQDAINRGNIPGILRAGAEFGTFRRTNAKHFPNYSGDDLDPTPRDITEEVPAYPWQDENTPGVKRGPVEEGPLVPRVRKETPAEAQLRAIRASQAIATDPKAMRDLSAAQIPRLLDLAKDPKISRGSRLQAMRDLGEITKSIPGLPPVFGREIKFDPFLEKERDIALAKEKSRIEEEGRDRQLFAIKLAYEKKQLEKLTKEIVQMGAKGGFKDKESQKIALDSFRREADAALKTWSDLKSVKEWERSLIPGYDKQLADAEAKYNENKAKFAEGLQRGNSVELLTSSADTATPAQKRQAFIDKLVAGGVSQQEAERAANANQQQIRSLPLKR